MLTYEARIAEIDRLRSAAETVDCDFASYLAKEVEDRMLAGRPMDGDAYRALCALAQKAGVSA